MAINIRIRDGLCPDPSTGDGGATEGDIRGSFSDIIDVIGVKDLAGGHCLVTQNSPAAMSVLVAPGVVYIPNANYDELDSNTVKFWEAIITVSTAVTITANTSGSARVDLVCAKMDTTITPDEHASNIATLVAVAGTPGAGVPATPDNYAKLAEVEVASGASTIVNADITSTRVQSKIDFDFLPKATGAEINTGTEDAKIVTPKAIADSNVAFTTDLTNYSNLNAPQGFLINGKIVPSVTSNNLTVAIKGLDGNDPSATNPVYCRIGDTIRSITAALSVTKNAGTNWCNAGGAELATKEIDYFVYLGYNATDGVVIGFSRIPYATLYSDFSATSTNEKYCGISTITNAAAGDAYENIGRFAATLSAGAGYTWTVPTFTTANLIQRPIYETRWIDWQPVYTASESMTYATVTTAIAKYKIVGNSCFARASTSAGTTGGVASWGVRFSTPITTLVGGNVGTSPTYDGTNQNLGAATISTSGYVEINNNPAGSNWTLGAGRTVQFNGVYGI